MWLLEIIAGVALGALGAALHLGILRWRARRLVSQGAWWVLATCPLGLVPPAAATLLALQLGPPAGLATLLGIYALRRVVLGPRRRC